MLNNQQIELPPEKLSLNAFEKGVKGDGVAKDGIPPAIADAAKSAGIEIKTKEPATEPAAVAAESPPQPPRNRKAARPNHEG